MRNLRVVYCTLLLILRTLFFPLAILKNFILLRKHRSYYKKMNKNGIKKFSDKRSYLAALRAQMGKDISRASDGDINFNNTLDFLRFYSQSDNKQQS